MRGFSVVPVLSLGAFRPKKSQHFRLRQRQEKANLLFQGCQAGGVLTCLGEDKILCFVQAFNWWMRPLMLGREICFTQSTNLIVILTQNTYTGTPRITFGKYLGSLWPSPVDM